MTREDLILAAMSPANGGAFTPVQVQKLFFLIDKKLADHVGGPHFNFEPHHYGPFDVEVYQGIRALMSKDLATIDHGFVRQYRLTAVGQQQGERLLSLLDERARSGIRILCEWVRSLSFADLVSAVYRDFPDMKVKSIFQG